MGRRRPFVVCIFLPLSYSMCTGVCGGVTCVCVARGRCNRARRSRACRDLCVLHKAEKRSGEKTLISVYLTLLNRSALLHSLQRGPRPAPLDPRTMSDNKSCTLRTRKMMKNPLLARRQMVSGGRKKERGPPQGAIAWGGASAAPARLALSPLAPLFLGAVSCVERSVSRCQCGRGTKGGLWGGDTANGRAVLPLPPTLTLSLFLFRSWTSSTRAAPTCRSPRCRRSSRRYDFFVCGG